jgi:hypothetical protein
MTIIFRQVRILTGKESSCEAVPLAVRRARRHNKTITKCRRQVRSGSLSQLGLDAAVGPVGCQNAAAGLSWVFMLLAGTR